MSENKQITIRRERAFFGMLRRLVITVDGVELLRIKQGETHTAALKPGAKTLVLHMGWGAAAPFDLAEVDDGDTLVIGLKRSSFADMRKTRELPFVIRVEKP